MTLASVVVVHIPEVPSLLKCSRKLHAGWQLFQILVGLFRPVNRIHRAVLLFA